MDREGTFWVMRIFAIIGLLLLVRACFLPRTREVKVPTHFTGRIATPGGRPIPGAYVLYSFDGVLHTDRDKVDPGTVLHSDTNGEWRIPIPAYRDENGLPPSIWYLIYVPENHHTLLIETVGSNPFNSEFVSRDVTLDMNSWATCITDSMKGFKRAVYTTRFIWPEGAKQEYMNYLVNDVRLFQEKSLLSASVANDPNWPSGFNVNDIKRTLQSNHPVNGVILQTLGITKEQIETLTEAQILNAFNQLLIRSDFYLKFTYPRLDYRDGSAQLYQRASRKEPLSTMEISTLNRALLMGHFSEAFRHSNVNDTQSHVARWASDLKEIYEKL